MKPTISHSEAETLVRCERQHYYSFGEKITSIQRSDALTRGQIGHLLMETFFKHYQETKDFEGSMQVMVAKAAKILTPYNAKNIGYLLLTMQGFFAFYRERIERWEIVYIEKTFKLETSDFIYAFTPDAIVRENGQLVLIDWKFVYDFYDADMIDLMPQIPRYIGALRALGEHVSHGYYAFLRYRNIKAEGENNRFLLHKTNPGNDRVKNSFRDLILSVEPISKFKAMPLDVWAVNVRRTAEQKVCTKMCNFKSLCVAELNGSDGKLIRQMNYEASSYGY